LAAAPSVDWSLAGALRTASFWLLVASFSITAFASAGVSFHQVPVLVENGLDPSVAAWIVSLYGFGWTIGSVGWGVIAERIPARFALAANNLLAGGCILALIRIHDVGTAVIYAVLYGLTNGGKEALDAVVWADYYGRRSLGAIRGYSRPLIVGANAGGGLVAGLAYDNLGGYGLVITAFGLLAISGGLLVLLARPPIAVDRAHLSLSEAERRAEAG
jgi:MFS family permease